jgi:hypothetical protein
MRNAVRGARNRVLCRLKVSASSNRPPMVAVFCTKIPHLDVESMTPSSSARTVDTTGSGWGASWFHVVGGELSNCSDNHARYFSRETASTTIGITNRPVNPPSYAGGGSVASRILGSSILTEDFPFNKGKDYFFNHVLPKSKRPFGRDGCFTYSL